jgi:hypothetical protein
MKTLTLYRFAYDDDGGKTDFRTYDWLRANQRHSACFASFDAALRFAKHAILASLDAEATDRSLLFREGVERHYDFADATWEVEDAPGIVTYTVPYRERTVEIDWASSTVEWSEWVESDYRAVREIHIDTLRLTVFDDLDNPTEAGT